MARYRSARACLLLAGMMILAVPPATAQPMTPEQRELDQARRDAATARERAERLERASTRATDAADRARTEAAAMGARIQQREASIAEARARIALIERLRARQRQALAKQRQPIAGLTAALQTMARRPAALALVQPGSVNDMVHARLLLGSAVPVIHQQTAGLRRQVAYGNLLRARADQAMASLKTHQEKLLQQRTALARLEAAERLQSRRYARSAMLQQERAEGFGEKARDIVDLMGQIDVDSATATQLASLPGPLPRPPRPGAATAMPPGQRLSSATTARLPYRLPVLGRVTTGFGELAESGARSRGLTLAARPDALVVSPAAGVVRFAGPFRDYGEIVIIDHGAGWVSLVTGLEAASVAVGESIMQGSPIGRTSARGSPRITVELRRNGQPIDIAPLAVGG